MEIKFTIKFFIENWKQGVHLIFRTKKFGVNNKWWSDFDSIFGLPTSKIIISILTVKPIYDNYRMMKFRAAGCHALSEETNKKLGWHNYWKKGASNEKRKEEEKKNM
jgi:hypothetical protein